MLNRTGEWFGHIAVQVATLVTFATFQQVIYGSDVSSSLPPTHDIGHTHAGLLGDRSRPLGSLSRPSPNMVAPGSNLLPANVGPLLAQIAPSSHALTGNALPNAAVQPGKPVNETVAAGAGAKPSGNSVKPNRF